MTPDSPKKSPFRKRYLPSTHKKAGGLWRKTVWFLQYLGAVGFFFLCGHLPPRLLGATGAFLFRHFGFLAVRSWRVSLDNLRRAYPEKTPQAILSLAKENWAQTGRTFFEYPLVSRFHLLSPEGAPNKDIFKVDLKNGKELAAAARQGRSLFLVSSHLANWEAWVWPMAELGIPMAITYRAPNNPFLHAFYKKRIPPRCAPAPKGRIGSQVIFKALRRKDKGVVIMIDQRFDGGEIVSFFGRPAATTATVAKMARHFDSLIVMGHLIRNAHNCYEGVFHFMDSRDYAALPPHQAIHKITQDITAMVEGWIRQNPHQWFWMHNRWRLPKEKERGRGP